MLDPFVACTQAAAATETLRIGTGICLVDQHQPIALRQGGRPASTCCRTGASSSASGPAGTRRRCATTASTRATRFAARCASTSRRCKAIWRDEEASYAGRDVRFERIWSWPKPVQRPHPPILVGGNGEHVLDRVLAYGDHWMPNVVGGDDALLARIEELRARAADAGREIGVTINAAPSRPERLARYARGRRRPLSSSTSRPARPDAVEAKIERVLGAAATVGLLP